MAKRMTKAESTAIGIVVVLGTVAVGVGKIVEVTGVVVPLLLIAACVGGYIWNKHVQHQRRLNYLREKYREEDVVQRICQGYFWQGQTAEQVIDSIGQPVNIDKKILKTKSTEVWKYNQRGVNRYGLRITLENNRVVGWDQKA